MACETDIDFRIKSKLVSEIFTLIGVTSDLDQKPDISLVNPILSKYAPPDFEPKQSSGKEERKRDLKIILETREELERCENFKLLFPSYNFALYKQYFEDERPLNKVLFEEYVLHSYPLE